MLNGRGLGRYLHAREIVYSEGYELMFFDPQMMNGRRSATDCVKLSRLSIEKTCRLEGAKGPKDSLNREHGRLRASCEWEQ